MIKVDIFYQDDRLSGFSVQGHAGFAEAGSDIYCAGVSAISQTILLGLINNLSLKPDYEMHKGCLTVKLPQQLNSDDGQKAQIILTTFEAGITSMARSYPQYVKVDIRRCKDV